MNVCILCIFNIYYAYVYIIGYIHRKALYALPAIVHDSGISTAVVEVVKVSISLLNIFSATVKQLEIKWSHIDLDIIRYIKK